MYFLRKDLLTAMRAQPVLRYHLISVPCRRRIERPQYCIRIRRKCGADPVFLHSHDRMRIRCANPTSTDSILSLLQNNMNPLGLRIRNTEIQIRVEIDRIRPDEVTAT